MSKFCWEYWAKVISPRIGAGSSVEALTLAMMASGVLQHSPPRLEMLSQLPPFRGVYRRTECEVRAGAHHGQDLRQRIRAALGHHETDAIQLAEDLAPTVTLMGMVTTSVPAVNTTWPL